MPDQNNNFSRRDFLGNTIKFGAGSLLLASAPVHAAETTIIAGGISQPLVEFPDIPTRVLVTSDGNELKLAERQGSRFTFGQTVVNLDLTTAGQEVRVNCPTGPLSRVVLRWETSFPGDTLFLGDAWERSYGDLQWRFLQPERIMPWYFAAHQEASRRTFMAGVKTQPATLCFWTVDAVGISLWLDFRNGGGPAWPGDRDIAAATIVTLATPKTESPHTAITRFCRRLCDAPRLAATPICGNNNWYYAYGRNFDADAMQRDAAFLAEIGCWT